MAILVVNCGSTSVKADILQADGIRLAQLQIQRLGGSESGTASLNDQPSHETSADHESAMQAWLPKLVASVDEEIEVVGHRVVHGGQHFHDPAIVTDGVLAQIEQLASLAPLHNPHNAQGIRVSQKLLPQPPHVAVFDTAFHGSLPRRAKTYAIPHELTEQRAMVRYGFHGTSHAYVADLAADYLDTDVRELRIVTCHLGGGCSVCAVEYGRSVETSMGMTPLEGLVMGTRAGDVDPGLLAHWMRDDNLTADQLDTLLNKKSGLAGLSGTSGDMRDIEEKAEAGDDRCRLAMQVFCHRVRKYIGAYAAVMGGVDAIVFTAGIGQNSATVRHRIAQRLEFLGARLDEDANRDAVVNEQQKVVAISSANSRVKVLVAATDESHSIAIQALKLADTTEQLNSELNIPVAISARHIHLTQESVEALYGKGHQLTVLRELSQPGQFAAEETVTLGWSQTKNRARPSAGSDEVEKPSRDFAYRRIPFGTRRAGPCIGRRQKFTRHQTTGHRRSRTGSPAGRDLCLATHPHDNRRRPKSLASQTATSSKLKLDNRVAEVSLSATC